MRSSLHWATLRERRLPPGQVAARSAPIIANAAAVLQHHRLPMLIAFTPKMYTGLQVARNPGAPPEMRSRAQSNRAEDVKP